VTTVDLGSDVLQTGPVESGPSRVAEAARRASRPLLALRQVPNVATYAGLALTLAGGVLLLVAWGKTAGVTNVALQVPYLVSAGCSGLALVAVGLTVVNLAAKAQDATRRRAQASELHALVAELRQALDSDRHGDQG
jgi:hypothetical protein